MKTLATNTLFTPIQVGLMELKHRVVMGPLTRSRSVQQGNIPGDLMLEYYSQRASDGGLIVSEATSISVAGGGWFAAPGLYSEEQVAGWKRITDAVHEKRGYMFSQLWHTGRAGHVDSTKGATPVSSSVNPEYWQDATIQESTPHGWRQPSPHRALDITEIPGIVEDYRKASEHAKAAGFDGVELHAGNGYLPDQFLQDGVNRRTDMYGGSIENRSRLLLQVMEALVSVWGGNRVAVRIAPGGRWNGMSDSDPDALFDYVVKELNQFGLAYLHIIEPRVRGNVVTAEGQYAIASARLRKIFKGKIIAAGGFEPGTAEEVVEKGDADLVAFGRHFLANPDLPKRIQLGLPLNAYDRKTFYTFDAQGYTDYPFYEQRSESITSAIGKHKASKRPSKMTMTHKPYHFVAIVGGAIAGSVAAEILADNGIHVVVIEQNKKPYGKIEDGLPRWHLEQRKQEYSRIDARLRKPGVFFLPSTRLGRDLDFHDLCDNWGFSAVILANGAWKDRELGIPGAEEFVDKGLVYQNPFIYWYNHEIEEDYTGPRYQAPDEALVVGGGLASIDVAKILQLENYERALRARGVQTDVYELEKKGVPAVCGMHGIAPEDLGVKGCLLIYRRRGQDMPLAQPPENATPDHIAKTEAIRQKMLRLAQEKYLFRVQDRRVATGLLVEDGRLVGLKVAETKVEGRKAEPVAGSEYQLRAPMVISSIGSVPEKIPGVAMRGEYYDFNHETLPPYGESDHVFGVGNVVTGQGNIRSSLLHSQEVTTKLIENYIGVGDERTASARFYAGAEARGTAQAQAVRDQVQLMPSLSYQEVAAIEQRIRAFQERVGYTGDYDSWIASVTPSITAGQVDFPTDIALEATRQSSAAFYCAACR